MILVREIRKTYGRVHAVRGISFAIEPGEVVGLLGPNGAGKSTTIRILTSYLTPDAGSVEIDGHDTRTDSLEARRRIGYLPESAPLYPEMTPGGYLDYRARLYGLPRPERRRAVGAAMDRCRITDVAGRRIGHLSKGYRQRVGLAAALLHDPPVLVLDEPSNGLDPSQIRETRSLVNELAARRTMVVSSHILPEVERLATRLLVIAAGQIRADGPMAELAGAAAGGGRYVAEVQGDTGEYLRLLRGIAGVRDVRAAPLNGSAWSRVTVETGPGAGDPRPAISGHAARIMLPLRELHEDKPSLEHLFLQLTEGTGTAPEEASPR
ncbi:MAG TPA: ABC transporter ATP-binding protein [Phycisphaerales bacterium]|nr:ABC transporter ATP-binding protein [Phycisphaerales bacterium]